MSRFPSDGVLASVPEVPETEIPSAFSERLRRMISYLEYSCRQRFISQEIGALPITIQVCQARSAGNRRILPGCATGQGLFRIFLGTSSLFLQLLLAHPLSLPMARATLPDTIHAVLLTEISYRLRGKREIKLEN